jgi:hypothetical protein
MAISANTQALAGIVVSPPTVVALDGSKAVVVQSDMTVTVNYSRIHRPATLRDIL